MRGVRYRLTQPVNGGRAGRWSMAGLPISGVCEFVRIFPFQAISPDPSWWVLLLVRGYPRTSPLQPPDARA